MAEIYQEECRDAFDAYVESVVKGNCLHQHARLPDGSLELNHGIVRHLGGMKKTDDQNAVIWLIDKSGPRPSCEFSGGYIYVSDKATGMLSGRTDLILVKGEFHKKRTRTYDEGKLVDDSYIRPFSEGKLVITEARWPHFCERMWLPYRGLMINRQFDDIYKMKKDTKLPFAVSINPQDVTKLTLPSKELEEVVEGLLSGSTEDDNLSELNPEQISEIGIEISIVMERIRCQPQRGRKESF